jgi:hypothetical protein
MIYEWPPALAGGGNKIAPSKSVLAESQPSSILSKSYFEMNSSYSS